MLGCGWAILIRSLLLAAQQVIAFSALDAAKPGKPLFEVFVVDNPFMSGYIIIDTDTHVSEPPDLWTSRVPARMRGQVPRVEKDSKGQQWWVLGGERIANPGLGAVAGVGDMKNWPKTYEDMLPAAYDARARLDYMDKMGIWAMVMYPNVGGFGSQQFLKLPDDELKIACVKAFNDWQTEWASADPRRLMPTTSLPFWDVREAVREVRRCAPMGHKGILFTGEPQNFGQPLFGDRYWDPLWETAVELDLPISFHVGSGNMELGLSREKMQMYGRMAAFADMSVQQLMHHGAMLADVLLSGVPARFPAIKFVTVESGIGWIPFALEALDYMFLENKVREERPDLDMLPSQYFERNIYACYWFEQTAPRRLLDKLAVDKIMFETDFPHPTSLYAEEAHKRIRTGLADCDPAIRRMILWENAQRLYKVPEPTANDESRRAAAA
jgi:predicted TIM-barrel fold metal-dependent hydrolase